MARKTKKTKTRKKTKKEMREEQRLNETWVARCARCEFAQPFLVWPLTSWNYHEAGWRDWQVHGPDVDEQEAFLCPTCAPEFERWLKGEHGKKQDASGEAGTVKAAAPPDTP